VKRFKNAVKRENLTQYQLENMIFYSFYTTWHKDPKSLVFRTEEGWTELQVNLKMFDTKGDAEKDFFKLLFDNEDFRICEYFDTDKGKKQSKVKNEKQVINSEKTYNKVPSDFSIELDKVYNLDCLLFMAEIPEKYIDYIFTSPPYNITKQIGTDDLYKEYEDNLTPEEYFQWLCNIINQGMRITKKHFFMNIQMLGKNKECILELMGKYRHIIKDIAIWEKTIVAPHIQPGVMNSAFEFIFIFSNDEPEKKVFRDATWSQGNFNNVIKGINASQNKYRHLNKATFPMYLPRIFMQKFGKKADLWYDPFSGTGTTFHAAIIEERHFLGTEIDIEQCEATNKRVFIEESALKLDFGNE
jgi:DNA modification methylase